MPPSSEARWTLPSQALPRGRRLASRARLPRRINGRPLFCGSHGCTSVKGNESECRLRPWRGQSASAHSEPPSFEARQVLPRVQLAPRWANRAGCCNCQAPPLDGAMRRASSAPCQFSPRRCALPANASAPIGLRASPSTRRSSTAPRASRRSSSSTMPTLTALARTASSPLPLRQGRRPRRLTVSALQSFQRNWLPDRSASMSGAVRAPVSFTVPCNVPLPVGSRSARCSGDSEASTASRSPTLPLACTRLPPSVIANWPSPSSPCRANVPRASSGRPRRRPASFGSSRVASKPPASRAWPWLLNSPDRLPSQSARK